MCGLASDLDAICSCKEDPDGPEIQALSASHVKQLRKRCSESLVSVRTALRSAASAAEHEVFIERGPACVTARRAWQGGMTQAAAAAPQRRSRVARGNGASGEPPVATQPRGTGQCAAAAALLDSDIGVEDGHSAENMTRLLSGVEWLGVEGHLAEVPMRLANVALLLKVHVLPAMSAMPLASKGELLVCSRLLVCLPAIVLSHTLCSRGRRDRCNGQLL
jgi:hypothetical protein